MPTLANHPASGARRTRRLLVRFALLLVAVVLMSSACDASSTGGTGAAAPPTPTRTSLPADTPPPFPTHTPVPEWATYTWAVGTPTHTFRIDIPGVLQLARSSAPQGHSIVGWLDDEHPLPPDHPVAAELDITLDAADVTDEFFPCRTGTRITVGPGITGYQSDGFSSTSTSGGCGFGGPVIYAFWIANGVCYGLNMVANYSGPRDFMTRYGAIWQHILASFVPPGPPPSGGTSCS